MKKFSGSEFVFDVASTFLVAVLPLLIFLKHSGYPLLVPESLIIILMVFVFSLVCGLLMMAGGTTVRIILFAALAVLMVDVQTDWITTWGLRLLLNVVGWGILAWLVRRHISRIVFWLAGAMVLGTLLAPADIREMNHGQPGPQPGDRQDLPFILHIILDEQIGVEGIPAEFDPDEFYAKALRDVYLDRSFEVFGRAYSRYASTFESVPTMLNETSKGTPGAWFGGKFRQGMLLEENAWFDILKEKGYRLHVLQTTAFRFLDSEGCGLPGGDSLCEYETHDLAAFERATLTTSQKVPFVLGTYFRLSFFLKMASGGYDRLKGSFVGRMFHFPDWHLGGTRIAPLAAMNATEKFIRDLEGAGPGQAWFIHLLTPHFPYGFRGDCSMETDVSLWLEAGDPLASPGRNTDESRAVRYRLYLEQMRCIQSRMAAAFDLLERRGLWDDALVIVHGDHGSRISLWDSLPRHVDLMPAADYFDQFSTLFAVKFPGGKPRYDNRLLPLDHLFGRMILAGEDPGDLDLEAHPMVFLQEAYKEMMEVPLPLFDRSMP